MIGADPRFGVDRNRTLRERLVLQPRAGNAWNADHVTAVYQVHQYVKHILFVDHSKTYTSYINLHSP